MFVLTTCSPYLLFGYFAFHTHHASLRWFMNLSDPSRRLILFRPRLGEFKLEVRYKKGIFNWQVDTLSLLSNKVGTVLDSGEDYIHFIHAKIKSDPLIYLIPFQQFYILVNIFGISPIKFQKI